MIPQAEERSPLLSVFIHTHTHTHTHTHKSQKDVHEPVDN
jgi:hypothetical protein